MKTWTVENLREDASFLRECASDGIKPSMALSREAYVERQQRIADALDELADRIKAGESAVPVAVVDAGEEGLFVEILYGKDGSPLSVGDKLYAHPPTQPSTSQAPSLRLRVGQEYSTKSGPGLNVCTYKFEWLDESVQSHGVALWRNDKGVLHLQNISNFDLPAKAEPELQGGDESVPQPESYLAGDAEEVAESLSDDAEVLRQSLGSDNEISENMERAAEILRTTTSAEPAQAAQVPDEMLQQVFRGDEPGRFGYVLGWNDCRRAMLDAAPTPAKEG